MCVLANELTLVVLVFTLFLCCPKVSVVGLVSLVSYYSNYHELFTPV